MFLLSRLVTRRFCTNLKKLKTVELSKLSLLEKFRMNSPKFREVPVILKLDTPEFKSIFTPELETLVDLFKKYGYEIRIAGGAVRDILLGKEPKDLDFATTATPDEMKEMFTKENIRMINMKGEKHGTITARINDSENFEVTTLRIDVVTDGRHADVVFTTDWMLDANRRDLTINSMFLGLDGSVVDYFYGYEDLKKRRVAFVGDAETRIKEDYLRILRYFRFYGKIALQADSHEDNILHTIAENVGGLERISGERIWTELRKILEGNFAGDLMKTMLHCGIGKYIGLPQQPNLSELDKVYKNSFKNGIHPVTLLSSLLNDVNDAVALHKRLKFSTFERDLAIFIVQHREDKPHINPIKPYQLLVLQTKLKSTDVRKWIVEVLKYRNDLELLEKFEEWKTPKFPVSGDKLKEFGLQKSVILGEVINRLRNHWYDNDFNVSAEELLKLVPEIIEDVRNKAKA